jgi:hypothetical protein
MNTIKTLTAAIALAAMGAGAPAAFAQATSPADQQGATGTQTQMGTAMQGEISDQDLERFASAEAKVSEIRDDFSERLSQAEDQSEAQSLQLEAQEKMVEAVQSEGLAVPTYNEIATRMQTDPELQQRMGSMN